MMRRRVIFPSTTVWHSAPSAFGTGAVAVSYISIAVESSPNVASRSALVTIW